MQNFHFLKNGSEIFVTKNNFRTTECQYQTSLPRKLRCFRQKILQEKKCGTFLLKDITNIDNMDQTPLHV